MKIEFIKTVENELGKAHIYKNIIVMEAKPGVTISFETGFSILLAWTKTIGNHPWVYIANRLNSYAVNPTDYKYLEKVPTLKGFAIVTPGGLGRTNAELEEKFFNKPFKVFNTLDDAFDWSISLLED
ncbi:MAG: hypothetical protein KUG68_10135 [Flavobacteriaceae bacterium]|nr:hypothetical protein [Flavobacteriaceae bacterium]